MFKVTIDGFIAVVVTEENARRLSKLFKKHNVPFTVTKDIQMLVDFDAPAVDPNEFKDFFKWTQGEPSNIRKIFETVKF